MSPSTWFRVGAFLGLLGVAAGTFGAHGLESVIGQGAATAPTAEGLATPERRLENFKTGVHYHQVHALALLCVGLAAARAMGSRRAAGLAGWLFLAGIVLFSGALYAYGATGQKWFGMIAPIGGVALMVGWVALAAVAWPRGEAKGESAY